MSTLKLGNFLPRPNKRVANTRPGEGETEALDVWTVSIVGSSTISTLHIWWLFLFVRVLLSRSVGIRIHRPLFHVYRLFPGPFVHGVDIWGWNRHRSKLFLTVFVILDNLYCLVHCQFFTLVYQFLTNFRTSTPINYPVPGHFSVIAASLKLQLLARILSLVTKVSIDFIVKWLHMLFNAIVKCFKLFNISFPDNSPCLFHSRQPSSPTHKSREDTF